MIFYQFRQIRLLPFSLNDTSVEAMPGSVDFRWQDAALHLDPFPGAREILIRRHVLQPKDLIEEVCLHLSRNLTLGEWKQYLGEEEPYRKTCPLLPVE